MPTAIETLDGRRIPLLAYAAERGVTAAAIYHRSVLVAPGLRRELPPRPRNPRRVLCLAPDGRLLPLMDYAAAIGVTHQALIVRAGTYRRADDVWVIGPAGRPGRRGAGDA